MRQSIIVSGHKGRAACINVGAAVYAAKHLLLCGGKINFGSQQCGAEFHRQIGGGVRYSKLWGCAAAVEDVQRLTAGNCCGGGLLRGDSGRGGFRRWSDVCGRFSSAGGEYQGSQGHGKSCAVFHRKHLLCYVLALVYGGNVTVLFPAGVRDANFCDDFTLFPAYNPHCARYAVGRPDAVCGAAG